ncbi:MAG: PRTRC system protein A [Methylophilus sp.]|uniref:PRTRC system protein A n=1 Tax=Methylophilus sp. TaxID=29541 RepID=UPI003FA17CEE
MNKSINLNALALMNMGLVNAPVIGELPPIENSGQRVVVAKNGVFIQFVGNWLEVIKRVGNISASVPYGSIEEKIDLRFKKFPREMFTQFHEQAKASFPNEAFAYIHWNRETNQICLVPGVVLKATGDEISYGRVDIEDGWQCIGDIHSHPNSIAFYSELDNDDDKTGVKCSFVMGLDSEKAMNSLRGRFCVFGTYTEMDASYT